MHRAPDAYPERRRVDGLAVSSAERAVVDSWAAPGTRPAIRAAAITGVRRRICSPRELRYELTRRTGLRGRAELLRLVDLLADGCHSELEIWGCLHVLRAPGMPRFAQQRRLTIGSETFVLDAACEESMVAVEMDGAAWHGSRAQREADIRRDALVATAGWQTLRFSFARLTRAPDGVPAGDPCGPHCSSPAAAGRRCALMRTAGGGTAHRRTATPPGRSVAAEQQVVVRRPGRCGRRPWWSRRDGAADRRGGWRRRSPCRYSAATPVTCGVAIDVPLIVLVAVLLVYQAQVMPTPGANRSTQVP